MTVLSDRTVYVGGGFGTDVRERMSPALALRCAVADDVFARQEAARQRVLADEAAASEDRRIRLSIEMAIDRGEFFDMRQAVRNGGVGRTREEVVAHASARMDWEDARAAGQQARWVQDECNRRFYGDSSADTSAPTQVEVQEAAALAQRGAQIRHDRRERMKTVRMAQTFARWDREAGR